MPAIDKNRTPWILVISSMVLLFLFVGYWNVSSYIKEKKKLTEDVQIQLQLAYTEIKDSELIYFIQTHISKENKGSEFLDSISIFFDSAPIQSPSKINFPNRVFKEFNISNSDQDSAIILGIEIDTSVIASPKKEVKESEITIVTSSKLNSIVNADFDNKSNDSTNIDFKFRHVNIKGDQEISRGEFRIISDSNNIKSWVNLNDSFPSRLDSLYRKECDTVITPFGLFEPNINGNKKGVEKTYTLFKEKLIENNLPSEFSILTEPEQKAEGLKVTYLSGGFGVTEWNIDLMDYKFYIFQKMIPTLLFSLFLLGIISLAFWTLLRNWIKQNRLVIVKNEFINNMTHELKTPIATIGVALEAVSNFDLNTDQDKTKEYIDISRNEVNRLSLLVDKVLNIAAFDSKDSALSPEAVDIQTTIATIIQSMKLQLEDKNAQINLDNKATNTIIIGDKLHLGNVVYNIIDNALKYSNSSPKIDISINEDPTHMILTFSDNGQGIPKEYQSKIFDRFFRVPSEDLHDVKGHGLGLNYVQHIVHAHNGKISVDSIEGQSTTFTITLPKSTSNV